MTDYKHAPYSLGFKVHGDKLAKPIEIKGKHKWYAPWLRYPSRYTTLAELFRNSK